MTVLPYFTLTTDAEYAETFKFRIVSDSYSPSLEKSGSIVKTIDGELDVTMGSIVERHDYTLRVRQEEIEGYGSMDDLRTLYRLNEPNSVPSCKLQMVDNHGNYHIVIFPPGQLAPKLLGVMVAGPSSSFIVNITLYFLS